ncbi:MAG TPA: CRISPR-associated endonuclease Cas1 [Polyangiaceae bacterium]|nr:CRISPR-associated endonuclease Cas1 [Polyangiaceae bacterium]
MRTAYVVHDGATLRREGERLVVTVRHERKQELPVHELTQLVLVGNVVLTPGAVDLVVDPSVDTVLLSHSGRYRGRITGSVSGNVVLRLAQFRALTDPARTLALARRVVDGKIGNQRALLVRRARYPGAARLDPRHDVALRAARAGLELAPDLDAVRGCEGAASAAYFRALAGCFLPPDMTFDRRSRRPPLDPVNALLSFAYTLLANAVEATVERVGLDPYLGSLHAPVPGRPSLVCDLMEEHRPWVVDALVLSAVNHRAFTPEHFEVSDQGVLMKPEARRWLVTLFERRLETRLAPEPGADTTSYRLVIERQCRRLAKVFLEGGEYEPTRLRT